MRLPTAVTLFAAAMMLCALGCTRQDSSDFQEYAEQAADPAPVKEAKNNKTDAPQPQQKTDGAVTSANGQSAKSEKKNEANKSSSTTGNAPQPDSKAGFRSQVAAGVGAASRPLLDDPVGIRAESWMGPAVGPALTLSMINRVERPRENPSATADVPATNGNNTGGNPDILSASKTPKPPREVRVLVKENTFRVEGPEDALRITYDDIDLLKVLNMEPVTPDAPELMPDWLKELDGKRVRIRGFMSPSFQQSGLREFLLGRDNKACCFPGRAKVYDLFPVKMRDGHTTDYIQNRPFDVVGIFQIKPWIEDGEVLRLYRIVDAIVIP